MERLGRLILHYRWWWLVGILALTGLFFFNLPNLTMEDDETTWYPAGDPTLKIYQAFEDRFETDDLIVVGFQWGAPYSTEAFSYLETLSERLEQEVPSVTEVTSLTTVDDIVGTAAALEVRSLVDADAIGSLDADALRHRIAINPFIRGNLVSEDESTVSIVLNLQVPREANDDAASTEILETLSSILVEEEVATGIRFHIGGGRVTDAEAERILETDMNRLFPLSLALTAVLLLAFFRHLPSLILPLVTVVLSLGWTLGLKTLVGSQITSVSTTLFSSSITFFSSSNIICSQFYF